ncbi:hypothetical protein FIBSPDRAFT_741293 [Athelia psychrophila]|uniref:RRM Nup35-type domain-containing protein n=1 Tax=Athelia psychrophila TaxID=1759441 RepID=A0A166JMY1_9AGAM|nr:hypothetical protein FIBSPDRAFT_741293 [Fibularhizoctonia sp. CBS 109695]
MGGSTSSAGHHSHGPPWGSTSTNTANTANPPLGASLSDSFAQSRTHYQSGYMMSSAQNNAITQGSQRVDDVPTVQTKAKMVHSLSRGSAPDFGMESMFQKSRQRQTMADEDAPPMNSIYDIPTETYTDNSQARFQPRASVSDSVLSRQVRSGSNIASTEVHYVIVFGYPADKYSVTAEYFKSIGETTDPDPNTQITNCFRIGYRDLGEAMRAVKRNGEILGGSYMVGAKWADQTRANELLTQSSSRGSISSPAIADVPSYAMAVDEPSPALVHPSTPTYGTPIRLAPATSAFRKVAPSPMQGQPKPETGPAMNVVAHTPSEQSSGKGMLGQVSDLIFGW